MSSKNNKIDELDSNQLADSLLNNEKFLGYLILIVTTILYDEESGLGNKRFTSFRRKLNAKFKKLRNILHQARSLDFLKNIEKYLAQVRELKAEFIQLSSQMTHDDTTALHSSRAIKILESLTSHVAARKEEKLSSSIAAKCQDLYNFKDVSVPPELTSQSVYPMVYGTNNSQDGGSEQSDEDVDRNDADKNPAAGNNSDGPPTASRSSIALAANNSNTVHATAQTPSGNLVSITECNTNSQPTVLDGSNNNNNPTVADLPVTFNTSITDMGSTNNTNNSQVASGGPVAAASTGQSLYNSNLSTANEIAQESGDQSNGSHQCNTPTLLIPSSEGSTAPSRIQPFHHGEPGEQIQKEVEPHRHTYPEGEEVASVQEVTDHTDHGLASPHSSGSISYAETSSPTVLPTLVSEVKAAVQQVAVQEVPVQVFYSTFGEPHTPLNQNSEPIQTGILHDVPSGQTTCEATPESQFNATTATAATRLNSNTYLETTVENNEQCIFDIRS